MDVKLNAGTIASWAFCLILITIGLMNVFMVHPVPGMIYILLSLLYIPQTNTMLKKTVGFSIPPAVKIVLGLLVMWVTLGVGDLAEMYGL